MNPQDERQNRDSDDGRGEREDSRLMAPDMFLDVPALKVEEMSLDADDLHARVAMHAAAANLVSLEVGADVSLDGVQLKLKGVDAQAVFKVYLQQVSRVLERALTTVERNPELLQSILQPVSRSVGQLGQSFGRAVSELGEQVGESRLPGHSRRRHVSRRVARRAISRVTRFPRSVVRQTTRPTRSVAKRVRKVVKRKG